MRREAERLSRQKSTISLQSRFSTSIRGLSSSLHFIASLVSEALSWETLCPCSLFSHRVFVVIQLLLYCCSCLFVFSNVATAKKCPQVYSLLFCKKTFEKQSACNRLNINASENNLCSLFESWRRMREETWARNQERQLLPRVSQLYLSFLCLFSQDWQESCLFFTDVQFESNLGTGMPWRTDFMMRLKEKEEPAREEDSSTKITLMQL
jgi:hypothetical protein